MKLTLVYNFKKIFNLCFLMFLVFIKPLLYIITFLLDNSDEECLIHFKSDNEEMMAGFDTEELIEEILESLFQKYQ